MPFGFILFSLRRQCPREQDPRIGIRRLQFYRAAEVSGRRLQLPLPRQNNRQTNLDCRFVGIDARGLLIVRRRARQIALFSQQLSQVEQRLRMIGFELTS